MTQVVLPGILKTVAPYLDQYGYFAVAGFLLLENMGIPLPGETILIAASVYAGLGQLNIIVVAITAIIACIIGDNIAFAIGHYGGERVVLKYGRYILLTPERLHKAQEFFNKYGGPVVTVARFVAGFRQLNGIVAGTAEMKWPKFLLYNSLGAVLWVAVWSTAGFLAGNNIVAVYDKIRHYELYVLLLILVLLGLKTFSSLRKKKQAKAN
ncbi:MAG: DedA family protein [Patescibacteria group bacterium]|nr:DedA family protein [Patescibacteria group bacterium]